MSFWHLETFTNQKQTESEDDPWLVKEQDIFNVVNETIEVDEELSSDWLALFPSDDKNASVILSMIQSGDYLSILEQLLPNCLLANPNNDLLKAASYSIAYEAGVAALLYFLQLNKTGPFGNSEMKKDLLSKAKSALTFSFPMNENEAFSLLEINGERFHPSAECPQLLVLSILILKQKSTPFMCIWYRRALCTWLQCLEEENLAADLKEALLSSVDESMIPKHRLLQFYYKLETALVYQMLHMDQQCDQNLKQSESLSTLQYQLTGTLGKKTQFQTFDCAQMILKAKSNVSHRDGELNANSAFELPNKITLMDDTLLETMKPKDGSNESEILVLGDSLLLLALYQRLERSHPHQDPLMMSVTSAFLDRCSLLFKVKSVDWLWSSAILLLQSVADSKRSRTIERSVLQMEALFEQNATFEKDLNAATAAYRLKSHFHLVYPFSWQLAQTLARQYQSVGAYKSALQLFERLNMREQVILCYCNMGEESKAKSILNEYLEREPDNPKWHCLYGDLYGKVEAFDRSWQLSHHRYAKAMRGKSQLLYKQGDYQNVCDSLNQCLLLNPLIKNDWFLLGCACMRIENFSQAKEAFYRVIQLDHEQGDAWNNLIAIHSAEGEMELALNCLKQALKLNYDAWHLWDNAVSLSLQCQQWNESIHAMQRLLDLNKSLDEVRCRVLVRELIVLKDEKILEKCQLLLARLLSKQNVSCFHSLYAEILESRGLFEKALDHRLKAYRAMKSQFTTEDELKQAVQVVHELVNTLLQRGTVDDCYQAERVASSLWKRTRNDFEGTKTWQELGEFVMKITEKK